MISIVFITCNRQQELRRAILSCLGKTTEQFEIVVVDNQSTDQTNQMLKNLSNEHHFTLKYIFNPQNNGVAESRNQGYQAASGDIVFFLDDDAVVVTNDYCIEKVANFMRTHPEYGVVATEIYNVTNSFYQHGAFPKSVPVRKEGEVFNFIGASHFINKAALQLPVLYPLEFIYGGEELYLSILLKQKGLRVFYYNELLVNHIPSGNTRMSKNEIAIKNYSNFYNVKRYFTPGLFLPVIWLVMAIRVLLLSRARWSEIQKVNKQIRSTYNKKYRNPSSIPEFVNDIRKYGLRKIL